MAPAPASLSERYEDLGLLAEGGMGEVRRARDRQLGRVVALKLIRLRSPMSEHARLRFLAETRTAARLEHPGIAPLYEAGALPDGRLWFTMPEVVGRTFSAVIEEVHGAARAGALPADGAWTFRRLVDAFERVCRAVAYAHAAGVVHRDLKPDNIMVGTFGRVLVLDWGIARGVDEVEDIGEGGLPAPALTVDGAVIGTVGYMSPEQAEGRPERHGPASDVYALGVILRVVLTGRRPGGDGEGPAAGAPPPPELAALARDAMATDPADRPSAEAVADRARAWLEGAHRRELALGAVAMAEALRPEAARLRGLAADLRAEAYALLAPLRPHDPAERKAPGWALEDRAQVLEQEADVMDVRFVQALRAALNHDPELPEAHARLADHYREVLVAAEERRDARAAARARALLMDHDRGRHAAWLQGDGQLSLTTDPSDAEVTLERYVVRGRRLVPEPVDALGVTPLTGVRLPRGSYRLRVRAPGHAECLLPVRIEAGEHWRAVRPGATEASPLRLPRVDELGAEDCLIPAAWTVAGGDDDAPDALPRTRLWVDGFVARRFPVTVGEYIAFLDDLVARGAEDEAERHAPTVGAGEARRALLVRGRDGRFAPVADGSGATWGLDWPITLVDWHDAAAYAAWLAARTGLRWRLLHDQEWEKAARGVDGRSFPWGDFLDPTWACMLRSHAGAPDRAPVESFPVDESPYGVRGLAGNVREWCLNGYRREGPPGPLLEVGPPGVEELRMVRGGSWSSSNDTFCRAAARFVGRPTDRLAGVGFRIGRSLPGGRNQADTGSSSR